VIKNKKDTMLLSAFIIIFLVFQIAYRGQVLFPGRFFAEEGSFWWANTFTSNFFEQLTFIAPLTGYFLLNANLSVMISNIFPMTYSPFITTWISLFLQVQVVIAYWILSDKASSRIRLIGCGIILFSPILSISETFANSINSQTFLGVVACIYLLFWKDLNTLLSKIYFGSLLTLGFFSGWYSAILAPIYLLRYLFGKKSKFKLFIVILSICGLFLQSAVFLYQTKESLVFPSRAHPDLNFIQILFDLFSVLFFLVFGNLRNMELIFLIFFILMFLFVVILKKFKGVIEIQNLVKIRESLPMAAIVFIVEYLLVMLGDATPSKGLGGRYLVVLASFLLIYAVYIFQFYFPKNLSLIFLGLLFIWQSSLNLIQLSQSDSDPLLSCKGNCLSWNQNLKLIEKNESTIYYFWPQNTGEPNWAISSTRPRLRFAPFQSEIMGYPVQILGTE
jgi:hypothetical protein